MRNEEWVEDLRFSVEHAISLHARMFREALKEEEALDLQEWIADSVMTVLEHRGVLDGEQLMIRKLDEAED